MRLKSNFKMVGYERLAEKLKFKFKIEFQLVNVDQSLITCPDRHFNHCFNNKTVKRDWKTYSQITGFYKQKSYMPL